MKVKDLLLFVDKIVPHSFPEEVQIRWINEVEGRVQTEILLLSDEDLTAYSWPEHQETELFAKFPYDDIYWTYLAAMVAHANGEFGEYNNHITLFNERFLRFSAWFAGRYRPADGEAAARLYYLSAYGIALKHGFAGSEEAWLESLKGDPFTYEDFTPEQLQALVPKKGVDYLTPEEIGKAAGTAAAAAAAAVMQSTADNAKQAEEAASAAKLDANRAEAARDKGPQIGENGNWFVWDAAAGAYEDTGRTAEGDDGCSPLVQVEPYEEDYGGYIQRGHRVTVTDVTKSQTFDIANGMDGTKGINGDVYVPSVNEAGVLSWSRKSGSELVLPPQPVNIVTAVLAALPKAEEAEF